jgi:RNA polymerase sigma-70 factor, ECF subfamily
MRSSRPAPSRAPPPGTKAWVYRLLLAAARAGDLHGLAALHGPVVDPARFHPGGHARSPGHWSEPPQAWPRRLDGSGRTGPDAATVVDRAVARLPQAERVVLSFRDVAGSEVDETCAVAGVSAAEARALLHRGRSVVRQALENHYADGRRPRERETSQVLARRNRYVRASRVRDDH